MTGSANRPLMSAPTAMRTRHVDHLAARQAPERIGGSRVAELREQGRVHQFRDERAVAHRRKARLRSADDRAVARGDRSKRRLVAVDHGRHPDVDRLRCKHESGAAKSMDLEVEPPAAVGLPGIVDPPGRRARQVEIRPEDVEHLERHGGKLRVNFRRGAAAARYRRHAPGEAEARSVRAPSRRPSGSAQLPA